MLKKKSFWAMVKPGTVLIGTGWKLHGTTVVLKDTDTKFRYHITYQVCTYPAIRYDWGLIYDGNTYIIEKPEETLTEVKIPTLSKEFQTLCVKGSEWEFETEWRFSGYVDYKQVEHVVPAGTTFKVTDKKMRLQWYSPMEKCIVADAAPGLEPLFMADWGTENYQAYIPAREAHVHLKLVTAGKEKTYWVVEDNLGEKILTKRYGNLGNVKAALRVRGGLVRSDSSLGWDDQAPEWIVDGGNEWGTDAMPLDNGVWAVHYRHADNFELAREDMLEYMTMAKLSA